MRCCCATIRRGRSTATSIEQPDDELSSFVPLAFIGVVVLALLADVWLYRTRSGLAFRAVGLDETAARAGSGWERAAR